MREISISTKPTIYDIKDVNRLVFHIFFPVKRNKNDRANLVLTKRMLMTCSKLYDESSKLGKAFEDNLIMNYSVDNEGTYNYDFIIFKLSIPKDKIIKGYSIDNALEVFHELIFNPLSDGKKFDEKHFNLEKKFILDSFKDYPRDITEFAMQEIDTFVDHKVKNTATHDEYMKLLDKATPKSAYDYYKKAILNNNYFTFITGCVENKRELLVKFNKYFNQALKDIKFKLDIYDIHKVEKYKYKVIEKNYNQSLLYKHYNIKKYKEDDRYKLKLLYFFLQSKENNLIYHKLRRANNLIYHASVSRSLQCGTLNMFVYLDYHDVDTANKLISEVFDELRNKELFELCMNRTIKAITYDLLSQEDNSFNILSEKINNILGLGDNLKDTLKIVKKITYDEMIEFMDRVVLSRELLVKGGASNEK